MSENIENPTETATTETEQVIFEARVDKKTLRVAAIASAAGALVAAGAALFVARRNNDEPAVEEYVVYEESENTDTE